MAEWSKYIHRTTQDSDNLQFFEITELSIYPIFRPEIIIVEKVTTKATTTTHIYYHVVSVSVLLLAEYKLKRSQTNDRTSISLGSVEITMSIATGIKKPSPMVSLD